MKVWERERRFLTGYDFRPFTGGAGEAGLGLHSTTIQAVAEEYAVRRKQAGKAKLRWRASDGSRRSLGWGPFRELAIRYRKGQRFLGKMALSLWDSYGVADYDVGAGNISEDARGRWYINISVISSPQQGLRRVGVAKSVNIDLDLRDFANLGDGHVVGPQRHYRLLERELAKAQRVEEDSGTAIHGKLTIPRPQPTAEGEEDVNHLCEDRGERPS